jgi:hypothetical protein
MITAGESTTKQRKDCSAHDIVNLRVAPTLVRCLGIAYHKQKRLVGTAGNKLATPSILLSASAAFISTKTIQMCIPLESSA